MHFFCFFLFVKLKITLPREREMQNKVFFLTKDKKAPRQERKMLCVLGRGARLWRWGGKKRNGTSEEISSPNEHPQPPPSLPDSDACEKTNDGTITTFNNNQTIPYLKRNMIGSFFLFPMQVSSHPQPKPTREASRIQPCCKDN